MSLNTYLYFDGDCAGAFDFYKSVFGGEFAARQTYGDGPPDLKFDNVQKDWIMHVSLPVGGGVLMGSDRPGAARSDDFAISYNASSSSEADRIYAALSKGGEASMSMQETFWGSYFGTCRDRFGVNWMVSADPKS